MTRLDSVERRIVDSVEQNFNDQVGFIQELIAVPSFPGSKDEGTAQSIMRRELQKLDGVEIDEWTPTLSQVNAHPNHPIRDGLRWDYKGRPNVVGLLRGSEMRSLLLNGHIDVVSPEPIAAWKRDPWKATIDGDKIYGRGSNDMKAGLSCILFALKAFQQSGLKPRGNVIIQSVVEEEFGGGGTIAALQRGYKASAALIPEPTGASNLCLGSAGSRFIRIDIAGRSDAPQSFHRGVNAIEPGYRLFKAVSQLNEERERRLRGKNPIYEKRGKGVLFGDGRVTNLVIGRFRAGDFPATVAGYAQLEGRIGFPSPETGRGVIAEYESAIRLESRKDGWLKSHPPAVSWFNAQREPYLLDISEPIVEQSSEVVRSVVGRLPLLFATPSSTDAAFLVNRAGKTGGIPTIVYGPGGDNAHGADEFVRAKEVRQVTAVIAILIKRWCGLSD